MSRLVRRTLRIVVTAAGLLVVYAVAPVPGSSAPSWESLLLLVLAVGGLSYVTLRLVRRQRAAQEGDTGVRLETFLYLVMTVIGIFAWIYLGLDSKNDQFDGLANHVDALYFTLTTLTTVGYGDVHAVGKLARIAVSVQLLFDVVFIGVAARLIGDIVMRSRSGPDGSGEDASAAPGVL